MSINFRVSELTSVDKTQMPFLHQLVRQLSTSSSLPSQAVLQKMCDDPTLNFIVAHDDNGRIIAMLCLVYFRIPTGIRARIEDVVVLDTHRRRGIARKLSEYAIDLFKSSGARTLDLTSSPSRIAANKLYERLGFVRRETNVYRYE